MVPRYEDVPHFFGPAPGEATAGYAQRSGVAVVRMHLVAAVFAGWPLHRAQANLHGEVEQEKPLTAAQLVADPATANHQNVGFR